jgi:hypothetical protein
MSQLWEAMSHSEGGSAPVKPTKKKRGPRSLSAYQVFMKMHRQEYTADGKPPMDVMRDVARAWKELGDKDRHIYEDKARDAKEKLAAEKALQAEKDAGEAPGPRAKSSAPASAAGEKRAPRDEDDDDDDDDEEEEEEKAHRSRGGKGDSDLYALHSLARAQPISHADDDSVISDSDNSPRPFSSSAKPLTSGQSRLQSVMPGSAKKSRDANPLLSASQSSDGSHKKHKKHKDRKEKKRRLED